MKDVAASDSLGVQCQDFFFQHFASRKFLGDSYLLHCRDLVRTFNHQALMSTYVCPKIQTFSLRTKYIPFIERGCGKGVHIGELCWKCTQHGQF
jgi:hypothetical protein